MPRLRELDPGEISVGSDFATIRRPHEQRLLSAGILHQKAGPDGAPEWVVLDRLVHGPEEHEIGGWNVRGAVTTELYR